MSVQDVSCIARIVSVDPGSPADDAGFEPGCSITAVDGHDMRDIIDWRWYGSDDCIEVSYIDLDGDAGTVELEREEGQSWGIVFDGVVFNGIRQCRNACVFCFMRQLPEGMRSSLTLRDDDYRLSFMQGTFVTFTNMTPQDEQRVIDQHISPLRYSLHAVSPEVRRSLIGKHADVGIAVAERLLAQGIELHAQIVLVPGINDADELDRTLAWAWEHPGIVEIGIVPLGYTSHQDEFTGSFNDRDTARAVIDQVARFQVRAREQRGISWVQVSDEFYRNAYPDDLLENLPSSDCYDGFGMFEDGIGIVRSFVDDWNGCGDALSRLADELHRRDERVVFVCGCAQREFFPALVKGSPLADCLESLFVENRYFGGNVDVTGLLCGCDIADALAAHAVDHPFDTAVVPRVVFNDDALTLDDMSLEDIVERSGCDVRVVSCNASEFASEILDIIEAGR